MFEVDNPVLDSPYNIRGFSPFILNLSSTYITMIPGELLVESGNIELNAGRLTLTLDIANTGDRPIQVGSHYHFYEVNLALDFDREATRGMRLDIPAGTAIRFEPGDQRSVRLVPYVGSREVYGFTAKVNGPLDMAH